MLLSQKGGGSQKDMDMVGSYFGKNYFDGIIYLLQQKVEIKTQPASGDCKKGVYWQHKYNYL